MRISLFLITLFSWACHLVSAQGIGSWAMSARGLPVYQYTGQLPVKAVDKAGTDAMLPDDPYFLLGNYRLTLFAHASGIFQFLSGERGWARLNGVQQPNYGWNEASLAVDGRQTRLTGLNSVATDPSIVQKSFGVGTAKYQYQLPNGIVCTRVISVKPSAAINTGNPAFVITVSLKNTGAKTQRVTYVERMLVNYTLISTQFTEAQKRPLLYHNKTQVDQSQTLAVAEVAYDANTLLTIPGPTARYSYDIAPPTVFMHAKSADPKKAKPQVSGQISVNL